MLLKRRYGGMISTEKKILNQHGWSKIERSHPGLKKRRGADEYKDNPFSHGYS